MIDRFLTRIANARSFAGKLWVLMRPYWFAEERQRLELWGYSVTVKEAWIARAAAGADRRAEPARRLHLQGDQLLERALLQCAAGPERRRIPGRADLLGRAGLFFIVALVYRAWLRQLLTIRWRRWLSEVYFRDWLADRTYYRMELTSQGTDNPEQRIEQDCKDFAEQTLELTLDLFLQVLTFVTFAVVLWNLSGSFVLPIFGGLVIPGYMMWAAILLRADRIARHLPHRPAAGGHQLRAGALQRRLPLPHGAHPRERGKHRALPRRAGRGAQPARRLRQDLRHLVGLHEVHQAADLADRVLRPGRRRSSPSSWRRRSILPARSSSAP